MSPDHGPGDEDGTSTPVWPPAPPVVLVLWPKGVDGQMYAVRNRVDATHILIYRATVDERTVPDADVSLIRGTLPP